MALKRTAFSILMICFLAMGLISVLPGMVKALSTVEMTLPIQAASTELLEVEDLEMATVLQAVVIDPTYSHAVEEHPEDASIVHNCFSQKGAYMQFQVEANKRYLRVCIIDEVKGLLGFQIVDIVGRVAKERTAYIKDAIQNIRELLEYARKMGYPRFKGSL